MLPCRRHGKKRNGKEPSEDEPSTPTEPTPPPPTPGPQTPTKKESKKNSKAQAKQQQQQQQQTATPLSRAPTPASANNSSTASGTGSPSHSAFSAPVNQNNMMNSNSNLINMASMIDNFTDAQLQSNQISSTVLDSPYSYDYTTGSYIDKRNYYNQQWMPPGMDYGFPERNEQVKSRSSEENPDSTTLINANNSAFSPNVPNLMDVSKLHDPLHSDAYATKEHGFVKPKPPEYHAAYGYHHTTPPTYPMYPSYPTPAYNQPHHYNNLDYYNNDKLRYNFYNPHHHHHHHQSYNPYDYYHHPQTPTQAIPQQQTPPVSNWNLYPTPPPSSLPPPPQQTSIVPQPLSTPINNGAQPIVTALPPPLTPQPNIENIEEPSPKSEPIGEITEINDNTECFQDSQMGGIGIALEHGSVLIECAKHEMHATTALKKPNRLNPTRITLIFYQHRNLNRHRHGIEEWEEKMRLKRLGITAPPPPPEEPKKEPVKNSTNNSGSTKTKARSKSKKSAQAKIKDEIKETPEVLPLPMIKEEPKFDTDMEKTVGENDGSLSQQHTSGTWTPLYSMHPCAPPGSYHENINTNNNNNNGSPVEATTPAQPPSTLSSGTYPNTVIPSQQTTSPMQPHHQHQ